MLTDLDEVRGEIARETEICIVGAGAAGLTIARRLLGKGHLIGKLGSDEKIYMQVPFIGDDEVDELAEAVIATWAGGRRSAIAY